MKNGVFSKDVPPRCEYCLIGVASPKKGEILCKKKGAVSESYSCRSFRYDPLRRTPREIRLDSGFSEEDFKL